MANKTEVTKEEPKTEDLMKAIADVIDTALEEWNTLNKNEGIDFAQAVDDKKGAGPMIVGEGTKDGMAKEDPEMKPEDKDDEEGKEDEEEEDDEKLMDTYKSVVAKMEKKGLMAKMDKKEMKKSEKAPAALTAPKAEVESLRKSVDERFEGLNKTLGGISEAIKKLAAQPAPRKGVAGYQPLKKNDETEQAPQLKKSEVIGKLLELRKSGDARVDSTLINRVETGRLIKSDYERIKGLIG